MLTSILRNRSLLLTTLGIGLSAVACGDVAPEFAETSAAVGAGGVTGAAFYFEGELYRTVGTPTTLPSTAPDHSFDVIYVLRQCQSRNVANAGPGSTNYNGGRWMVHPIQFDDCAAALAEFDANQSGDFDSASEVEAALDGGAAVDLGTVRKFVCPVIPLPKNER